MTLTTLPIEVKIVPSPFLDVFAFVQRPVGHTGRRNSSVLRRRAVRGGWGLRGRRSSNLWRCRFSGGCLER